MEREKLGSRLSFILISAGCAIGLGNVYRFPITAGAYGGSIFVFVYLLFLVILGIPAMTCELAVGRASKRSIAYSFDMLEKPGQKWHLTKYLGIGGNYLLMMFYTVISGWIIGYFFKYCTGSIMEYTDPSQLGEVFGGMIGDLPTMILTTGIVIVVGFGICAIGLKNGVERITKIMMVALFVLMLGLVIYCLTLPNAAAGLEFYLVPNFENAKEAGFKVISAAMGQAFFTLSIGIGSIAIFGSYIGKERRLLGESVTIAGLDSIIAIMAGLIIFPACFTYNNGVTADADSVGAGFLFTTLSSVFNNMPGGRIVGIIFFLLMIFASLSTVIAVFENIMSFWIEKTGMKRLKIALINVALMIVLVTPAVLSTNVLADFSIFGKDIIDFEDFFVSNLFLPIGALIFVVFCTWKKGWGFDNYIKEVNCGEKGLKVPKWIKIYMQYVLPLIIIAVLVISVI